MVLGLPVCIMIMGFGGSWGMQPDNHTTTQHLVFFPSGPSCRMVRRHYTLHLATATSRLSLSCSQPLGLIRSLSM